MRSFIHIEQHLFSFVFFVKILIKIILLNVGLLNTLDNQNLVSRCILSTQFPLLFVIFLQLISRDQVLRFGVNICVHTYVGIPWCSLSICLLAVESSTRLERSTRLDCFMRAADLYLFVMRSLDKTAHRRHSTTADERTTWVYRILS